MVLKPQDILVALKLCTFQGQRPPFSVVASELAMSPSEVHGAVRRLQRARLVHRQELGEKPNLSALQEFLLHGVQYAFPSERGEVTRGVPTSYAAEPLKSRIASGEQLPPVWPYPEGKVRGTAFSPLYPTVPIAALRDPVLYEYLALVDAIREGRAREKRMAERELTKRLRTHDQP